MNIHEKFNQQKSVDNPNTTKVNATTNSVESISNNSMKDKSLKRFFRKNSKFFNNDLSTQDKNTLIKRMENIFSAILAEELVTVNAVARMLGIEHTRVAAFCSENDSLKDFINGWTNSTKVNKVLHNVNYLSKEELNLLKQKISEQEESFK